MPDWERLVAERLAHSKLTPELQREVVAEIAAHLEECYCELVRAGSSDPEGQTRAQVRDWNALCRKILRSKEDRMSFARKVVMPGIAALIVALAALRLFVYMLIAPESVPCGPDLSCVSVRVSADGPAYLPWLATLPLAGALAAGLARRMDAQPVQRLVAALFPALYLALEMFVMGLVFGFFWRIPIYWVIIPAMVCALGAVPFLGDRRDAIQTQPVATTHP
jgi:hypothetical protein